MTAFPMYGMNGQEQVTGTGSFEHEKPIRIRAAVTGQPVMWMRSCRITPVKRMNRQMIRTGTMAAGTQSGAYRTAITNSGDTYEKRPAGILDLPRTGEDGDDPSSSR
jgi:hypothetical protein